MRKIKKKIDEEYKILFYRNEKLKKAPYMDNAGHIWTELEEKL